MHAEDPQPPIRLALGSRLHTAGDLFLGALALLVLDAIVAWIVWSAFSNAVYLIGAVFAVVGLGLGAVGLAIKRRARADGRRRHEARLILEAAGPHTEDDEIDGVVWAWLVRNKASRQVLPVSHVSFVEGIENRVARGIARVWIVNEADAFAGRAAVTLEALGDDGEDGSGKGRALGSVFKRKAKEEREPLPAARFSCWPTLSGKQLNEHRMDRDAGTVMLAGLFCLGFGGVALYGGSWLGVALLVSGIGLVYAALEHARSMRLTNGWAIAMAGVGGVAGWIVRLKGRRIVEAHPIDERALVVVSPVEQRGLLGRLRRTHRTRVIMPEVPGLPVRVFEADGVHLAGLADGMGVELDSPAAFESPVSTAAEHAEV